VLAASQLIILLHVIIWSMQQRLSASVGGNCSREV
jgi:hypothetical protein